MAEKESALWHRVNESERNDILISAKKIMDNFHEALSKVEQTKEAKVERDECERPEGQGNKPDEEFRKRILENSKNKTSDCIVAERGAWT